MSDFRVYRTFTASALAACVAAGLATSAQADCASDAFVAVMAADILKGTPTAPPEVSGTEDALCTQAKLVPLLAKEWGEPAGYKAGLTSEAAQRTFGVSEPVRGVLYKNMMLEDGAHVPAGFGAIPRFEADMIAVIGDAAVNAATTPEQVLANLSAIHPFIELPDLAVNDPKRLNGPVITAINVGARQGVLGEAIAVSPEVLGPLASMQVVVADGTGAELSRAPGAAILGQPLNAILWLRKSGVEFRVGDWVSLGSFGPLLVPKPGLEATVRYIGLPGDPELSVAFD